MTLARQSTEKDPYLALTLDLKRRIAQVARALDQPHPGPAAWGLWELLEDVWRRKDAGVTSLLLAACFGPDPRWPGALVAFGVLVVKGTAWELCAEEANRLLRTHRQRVAGGKSRAAAGGRSLDGRWTPAGPSAGDQLDGSWTTPLAGAPAEHQLESSLYTQHPAPSTQHPAPGERRPQKQVREQPTTAPDTPPDGPTLGDQLEAVHQELRHRPLEWGPSRTRVAIERALGDLAAQHGDAEVVRRLKNALTVSNGKFPYLGGAGDLARHWSHYAEPHVSTSDVKRSHVRAETQDGLHGPPGEHDF